MYNQRRSKPESTYASQAARWKQGFKQTPSQQQQQQQPAHQQTYLENALVSDLCSSIGSSSFPPREVLQKLLRYLHTLDHDYICELLDDKFESPLWQVKAKALSVLSALLGSGDAEFYKQYYGGRLDLLNDLRSARKDMLRKRADKVYALLQDYVPPPAESSLEMMRRMQEEEAEEAAQGTEVNTLMRTSPVVSSQQNPHNLMMNTSESPRSSSAPLPAVDEASGFNFLVPQAHQPQQEYAPAEMMAAPMTPPVSNSAFGFLSASGGEVDSQLLPSAPPESDNSAFRFLVGAPSLNGDVPAAMAPLSMPAPSAPPLASFSSALTSSTPSLRLQASVELNVASLRRRLQKFRQTEKVEDKADEPDMSDPIHDPFKGLDANDGAQALDSFDAYKLSSDAVHSEIGGDVLQSTQSEPLREVILEIDVPPGPMGVMLDRTIPDMTVIERFVPLPTENKGLAEVGPILGSLSNAPKLLRFKKPMNNGRTANPSTLQMHYVPPPLKEEEGSVTDKKGVEGDHVHPESEGIVLSETEAKLKEIIRRERSGKFVVDRRDQLAQLHGNVEKIQTQGIDSVIFGERRPPNYEEVKQFRLTLVRKADELARLIQSTASTDPPPYKSVAASDEEKHLVSAFAFVGGNSNRTVNDPPLGISQLQGESGFQFLNANANPQVATNDNGNAMIVPSASTQAGNSYGFSFLRDNAQEQPAVASPGQLAASQAPTSPSSSFGVLSTDGANPAVAIATNVFAGLSLKNNNQHHLARPAAVLYDTLTKSSHGRPMGLSDLEASLRSTASGRPPMGVCPADQASTIAESTQSSFGFMSTMNADDGVMFNSSSASTEPTLPTELGFLRSSNTSSTTPTMASSSISQSQRSVLQEPEPSMFSFISN
ncbi:unnamed protein product [Peronospora destructor]|uniref:VHS domain-containing protein n=1 Tax=Peronospora destructor TaxID=86335 RepID=A0AAV0VBR5_9STRA|nr:unnamed protein product [Peronospora destructor]